MSEQNQELTPLLVNARCTIRRLWWVWAIAAVIAVGALAWRPGHSSKNDEINTTTPILATNLQGFGCWPKDVMDLRFSSDSTAVCVSWWPEKRYGDQGREPWDYLVFDLHGRLLAWTADQSFKEVLRGFPDMAARILWPDFVKGGVGWHFPAGLSNAVRVVTNNGGGLRVEMWTLPPGKTPKWSTFVAAKGQMFFPNTFLFATTAGTRCVVVNSLFDPVAVLDASTGNVLDSFIASWQHDTEAVIAQRARKFPKWRGDSAGLSFRPTAFACADRNGVLVCGACVDKRVRVIELSKPRELAFEMNSDEMPYQSIGGLWRVRGLEFFEDGSYLLAMYGMGGRHIPNARWRYGIIETRNWREVWRTELQVGEPLCVSPDGQFIACVRNRVLEVRPAKFSNKPPERVGP